MTRIELTEEQARVLRTVLENYKGHLEVEIHRTERREFREALKKRNQFVEDILKRVSGE